MEGRRPTTRCKFRCDEVTSKIGGTARVNLSAVYPDEAVDGFKHSAEDHAFFNATPYGTLVLEIQNPHGAELFQAGDLFYLDISKAPKPEPVAT